MSSIPSPRVVIGVVDVAVVGVTVVEVGFLRLLFPLQARAGVDMLRKKGAVSVDIDDNGVGDVANVDTCENIIRLS